ncbi:MAG: hypothetical protein NDJ89_17715 [Oligoflexia bacterium]|nr:hypothetical protein [Oligoflexia bacterium]
MTQTQVSPRDLQLLRQEVEALGEFLNRERLDRVADYDRLKLELAAIKATLQRLNPQFERVYKTTYADLVQNYDPEAKAG